MNYLFSPRSQCSHTKEASLDWFLPLSSCLPSISYSTAPTVTYFIDISCEFKSVSVNVGIPCGEFRGELLLDIR